MTGAVSPHVIVKVLDDHSALARAAADEFTRCAREAVAARGQFTVALSGGSTPRTMYEALAGRPYRDTIVWPSVHVFWGDERHVPPGHSDSNFQMAYDAWLSRVPLPPGNIHRVKAEMSDARSVVADYERTLCEFFRLQAGEFPRFDLILLGLGPDGHTASLFPYSHALREASRLVVAPWVDKMSAYRITLTLPVLNAAASVVFLASGPDKAEAVRAVLRGEFEPERLPPQLVRTPSGSVTWCLDRDAARLLEQR